MFLPLSPGISTKPPHLLSPTLALRLKTHRQHLLCTGSFRDAGRAKDIPGRPLNGLDASALFDLRMNTDNFFFFSHLNYGIFSELVHLAFLSIWSSHRTCLHLSRTNSQYPTMSHIAYPNFSHNSHYLFFLHFIEPSCRVIPFPQRFLARVAVCWVSTGWLTFSIDGKTPGL